MQYTKEFRSIHEFYDYLCKTPFNDTFRWARHSSVENKYSFSKTSSFEEAVDLMKNGWSDMSQKLTQKLKLAAKPAPQMKPRNILSVAGYQPVVALYLAGVPQNMIDKQTVVKKQKIIELTKDVTYSACVSSEEIIEESIKSMMIVKKLEAQGFRVKLNIALGVEADGRKHSGSTGSSERCDSEWLFRISERKSRAGARTFCSSWQYRRKRSRRTLHRKNGSRPGNT